MALKTIKNKKTEKKLKLRCSNHGNSKTIFFSQIKRTSSLSNLLPPEKSTMSLRYQIILNCPNVGLNTHHQLLEKASKSLKKKFIGVTIIQRAVRLRMVKQSTKINTK